MAFLCIKNGKPSGNFVVFSSVQVVFGAVSFLLSLAVMSESVSINL